MNYQHGFNQMIMDMERAATELRDSMLIGFERAATDLRDTMLASNMAVCEKTLNAFMNIQRFL